MIVIGDTHAKNKEPYNVGVDNFFKWLLSDVILDNEPVVILGDLFDSSSPHNQIRKQIMYYLSKMSEVLIIQGNHDYSRRMGSSLEPLKTLPNITVLDEYNVIEGNMFLPFKQDMAEYESLVGDYNFIFTHTTPPECAFSDEGIQLNLNGTYIHGHTHMQKDFVDKSGRNHIVLGVPIPTRHLEDKQSHRIIRIKSNKVSFIDVPEYFIYETVKYGETPKSISNIINVIEAPSYKDVFDKYSEYYIRKEGISLLSVESDLNDLEGKDQFTIKEMFVNFAKEQNITEKGIVDKALHYLDGV